MLLKNLSKSKIQKQILYIVKNSGFHNVSQLQNKAIPQIMKKKHLLLSSGGQRGKTSLLFLPEIFAKDNNRFAIIIAPDSKTINYIIEQYNFYKKTNFNSPEIIHTINDEFLLHNKNKKTLLISTARNFISCLRSTNIDYKQITKIYFTDNDAKKVSINYLKDIEFILAKKHKNTATVFIFRYINNQTLRSIKHFIRDVKILDATKNMFKQQIIYTAKIKNEYFRIQSLLYILNTYGDSANIYCNNSEELKNKISRIINKNYTLKHNYYKLEDLSKVPCSDNLNINIVYDFDSASKFLPSVNFLKVAGLFFIIHTDDETEKLKIFKEQKNIHMKKLNDTDVNLIKQNIDEIIRIIQEESDPDLLNEYRKLIKKNVKFHLRGYFTAYLLKNANTKNIRPRAAQLDNSKKTSRKTKKTREADPNMTALFVSIGKNKRVYPKDLSNLFSNALEIEKSEIGSIKILDNFSFIEVPNQLAETAIEKLNKFNYKNTAITVNYSKSK